MRAASLSLFLRVLFASAWAGVLLFAGMWAWDQWAVRFADFAFACRLVGLTLAGMGVFVFCALVGDRLFPRADRRVTGAVEFLTGGVAILGFGLIMLKIAGVWA